jgi:hypothetical protein
VLNKPFENVADRSVIEYIRISAENIETFEIQHETEIILEVLPKTFYDLTIQAFYENGLTSVPRKISFKSPPEIFSPEILGRRDSSVSVQWEVDEDITEYQIFRMVDGNKIEEIVWHGNTGKVCYFEWNFFDNYQTLNFSNK